MRLARFLLLAQWTVETVEVRPALVSLDFALGLWVIISPFALVFKSEKHFNIAFLYFYDHLQGEIRDTITWSFFSKPLVTQSGSIHISKLAPKAFHSCKHAQTSAYSSIAARIVL